MHLVNQVTPSPFSYHFVQFISLCVCPLQFTDLLEKVMIWKRMNGTIWPCICRALIDRGRWNILCAKVHKKNYAWVPNVRTLSSRKRRFKTQAATTLCSSYSVTSGFGCPSSVVHWWLHSKRADNITSLAAIPLLFNFCCAPGIKVSSDEQSVTLAAKTYMEEPAQGVSQKDMSCTCDNIHQWQK